MLAAALILLSALALFMVAGGIPLEDEAQLAVFRTPVFIALMGGFGMLLIVACARFGRGMKRIPFWLAHFGVVLMLFGAGLGYRTAEKGNLALPVGGWHKADRAMHADGSSIDLDFKVSVTDFDVDFYDPVYRLYKPTVAAPRTGEDYTHHTDLVLAGDGSLDVAEYGVVTRDRLRDPATDDCVPQLELENGWILQAEERTPRKFVATVSLENGEAGKTADVMVNRPVSFNGWRIYLMSYGMSPSPYVYLLVRRDPGRSFVIYGIWCVLVGTAALCWRKGRRRVAA